MSKLAETLRKRRPLIGLGCYTYDPVFVDLMARLGFDAVWIEMEHCHITYAQAADLCRIASGLGLLTMIRIPDCRRENVLKAAECGPDMIDLPMANSPEVVEEFVRHSRYPPAGLRGFFGASRAVDYGLGPSFGETQQRINEQMCLIAQIETTAAVSRADEICAVPGLDAVFIGPGDLSTSLGVCGQINHPSVIEAIERVIQIARRRNKHVAMATPPKSATHWSRQGVDLLFVGSNVSCLKNGAIAVLAEISPLGLKSADQVPGDEAPVLEAEVPADRG